MTAAACICSIGEDHLCRLTVPEDSHWRCGCCRTYVFKHACKMKIRTHMPVVHMVHMTPHVMWQFAHFVFDCKTSYAVLSSPHSCLHSVAADQKDCWEAESSKETRYVVTPDMGAFCAKRVACPPCDDTHRQKQLRRAHGKCSVLHICNILTTQGCVRYQRGSSRYGPRGS